MSVVRRWRHMITPDTTLFQSLERRRTQALAHRDFHVVDELHADDYELVTPAGRTFSRL